MIFPTLQYESLVYIGRVCPPIITLTTRKHHRTFKTLRRVEINDLII